MSAEGVGRKIAVSAAFMVGGRFAVRCISVVSTLILARLLMPADFGLVALASAIFVVADALTATWYGMVIVRKAHVDREDYDTAWTLNFLRNGLLGGLVAATAYWQAAFLGDERIGPLLMVLGLTMAIDGLRSAGTMRLQREFQFGKLVQLQILAKFSAFLLTVIIAFATHSYWCLVLGNLLAKAIVIPATYIVAPYRPRLSLSRWREFLGFSVWSSVMNLFMMVDLHGPTLILGRLAGLPAVGMLNVAYQIAATPVSELAAPIRQPIYSGYATVKEDLARLGRMYLDGFGMLFSVMLPLTTGIALLASELEVVALGPRWEGTAPLIALCAFYVLLDSKAHLAHGLFTVLDRMRALVWVYGWLTLLRVPLMIAGAAWGGAQGLLLAMVGTAALNAVVWQWRAARLVGFRLRDAAAEIWRPLVAVLVMVLAVLAAREALGTAPGWLAALGRIGVLASVGAAVHSLVLLALWHWVGRPAGLERQALRAARLALSRLRGRAVAA